MTRTDTTTAKVAGNLRPSFVDGQSHAAETAGASLDTLPAGRRCSKCRVAVFTDKPHCPTCGTFLEGNTASLSHGKHSRKALQAKRLARLEELRNQYRRADGTVAPQVDAILREL